MAKKKEKSGGQEREGVSAALWLVPVLSIIDLLYYFLLSMGYDVPTFGLSRLYINYGSVGIQGLLLCVLAASHAMDRRSTAAECEDEGDETEVEDVENAPAPKPRTAAAPASKKPAAAIAAAPRAPEPPAKPAASREVFEYPPKISGGIYADSHIPVGEGRFLKLRTIIARSCLLCDEQGKCWDIVREDVEQDLFRSNIDCKEGLKIES
jgi:hypothetical protein